MATVYISLGSNLGDRAQNIARIRDQTGAKEYFGGVKAFADMPRKPYKPG